MVLDRRKAAIFAVAFSLRALLFVAFPFLPDILTGRVEISTPVTSFKRRTPCQAGLYSCHLSANVLISSRRPIPIQSQRISLRWRCILSGTSLSSLNCVFQHSDPPGAVVASFILPHTYRCISHNDITRLHCIGLGGGSCSHEDCRIPALRKRETFQVTQAGKMGHISNRSSVS